MFLVQFRRGSTCQIMLILNALIILCAVTSSSYPFIITVDIIKDRIRSSLPNPIIMIPGDGGSQAYAQFKDHQSDPFQIWVDLRYLISPRTFGDYFK